MTTPAPIPHAAYIGFSWESTIDDAVIAGVEGTLEHDRLAGGALADHAFLLFHFDNRLELIEAVQPRVHLVASPRPRLNCRLYRVPGSANLAHLYAYAAAHVGTPYDTPGLAVALWWCLTGRADWLYQRAHHALFCSELCDGALWAGGLVILPQIPPCQVTPARLEMAVAPLMTRVAWPTVAASA